MSHEIKVIKKQLEELGELIDILFQDANLSEQYPFEVSQILHSERCPDCLTVLQFGHDDCMEKHCRDMRANAADEGA